MNVSSIKTISADSPKTPGGISKSLLTPCRRVGLSRKWKKSGVSPFISPLGSSSSNKEVKLDNEIRKRKKGNAEVEEKDLGEDSSEGITSETCDTPKIKIDRTPTRALLPRKKSKTVLTTQKSQEVKNEPQSISELSDKNIVTNEEKLLHDCTKQVSNDPNLKINDENMEIEPFEQVTKVTKLSRKNSKSSNKIKVLESPVKNKTEPNLNKPLTVNSDNNEDLERKNSAIMQDIDNVKVDLKEKSPNNLTKECIVVIQKKIFKTDKITSNNIPKHNKKESVTNKPASQSLFDSDTDDVPLSNLNRPDNKPKTGNNDALEQITQIKNVTNVPIVKNTPKLKETNAIDQNSQNIIDLTNKDSEDTDFIETKKVNIKKPEKPSITGTKNNTKEKPKTAKLQTKCTPKPSPQSSNCDEDDDFDYDRSKTILVKKTYDKVGKLSKAKSTGSITQKDIDDITARIETKKNLLLVKAVTTDETKELRELIKKWQVGCQTALMELLDLMRKKLPDQNMGQSELLQMLKIPPDLVGYDSDSDNFNTPDDAAIILSALKLN
ncbi:uncharacterized protein LOC123877739 [Maniola jurtina]|uniref:uncharacterized protein LOC123877739 n=1 Tax=Maniola jurtina TaxID=191418 RepID=UPI001E68AC27|nr:uncharacterized protein LOC123877739 [Maniola jurtina]